MARLPDQFTIRAGLPSHTSNLANVTLLLLCSMLPEVHPILLGSHTVSVRALCNNCLSLCLSHDRSWKLSEMGVKFRHLYRKFGLPSKNMMSDFAAEVDKYPKTSPKPQYSNFGSVRAYCLTPLAVQLVIINNYYKWFDTVSYSI